MRKTAVTLLLVISAVLTTFNIQLHAAAPLTLSYDGKTTVYNGPEVSIVLNGEKIECKSMPPVIINDYTYVSARDVFEKLGAAVDWHADTSEVLIGYNGSLAVFKSGNSEVTLDGVSISIPAPAKIINDRAMIPLRFASVVFGFSVEWNPDTFTVFISEPGKEGSYVAGSPDSPDSSTDDTVQNSGAPELSQDFSPAPIKEENHEKTSAYEIVIPADGQNTFTIKAEGKISKVDKFLLFDNRLVVDIYNARLKTEQGTYIVNDKSYIIAVRSGQNVINGYDVARFVFDLTKPVGYSISLSDDRKNVIVEFGKNMITNISFEAGTGYDLIHIDGNTAPTVNIYPLTDPLRTVIDLPFGEMAYLMNEDVSGSLVSAVRSSQFTQDSGRIVADLKTLSSYSVTMSGNRTTIKITEPTYKNVRYDPKTGVLTISKSGGITASAFSHDDNYLNYKYSLTLPGDFSDVLGYGKYEIKDRLIDSFDIRTENGKTSITVNENKVLCFNVTEDDSYIYIAALTPKEKYSKIVVIDPGHGGSDPGASANGIIEKSLNLDIAMRLHTLLENDPNIKVYSTRLDDTYPTREERAAFANEVGDLFVSIHNNWFDNPKTSGTETYYYPHANDDTIGISSQRAAEIFLDALINELGSVNRGVKSQKFVVLNLTEIPAVLCEINFITNPEMAQKLKDPAYLQKSAGALYNAVVNIFAEYTPKR